MPKSSRSGWGRSGHRRAVLIGAIVLVVVLGGGAAAWAEVGTTSAGYRMATVTRADIGTTLTVVGTVEPVSDAAASFQVGGQVATLTATPGEQVTAGESLGTLATTALSDSVSSAESTVTADEAKLVEDEDSETERGLVEHGQVPELDLAVEHHDHDHDDTRSQRHRWAERHDHPGPDHADLGRVDALDRPAEGRCRSGPGAERLYGRQHQHDDRPGHLRVRARDGVL